MTRSRDGGTPAVAGGLASHIPVLSRQVLHFLSPRDGGRYVDATFGAGGHTAAILAAAQCRVIALDRDRSAVARGAALVEASAGRLTVVEERFSQLDLVLRDFGAGAVDGVLFDFGVSSMQLDDAARGFSFRQDGPLDMRMGGGGASAAEVVAKASEQDLASIIFVLGEERHARAVARAIVAARAQAAIRTTLELAAIVSRVVHARPGAIHPATRTFQALRLFVNEELNDIAAGLAATERVLAPEGRLVAISFHSLEDRIVKTFLAARSRHARGSRHAPDLPGPAPSFTPLTGRPVTPDAEEVAANPRARSAKLRAAKRTAAPAHEAADGLLPRLPSLDEVVHRR